MRKVIAVDFDGTMVEEDHYPLIGPEIDGSVEGVIRLQELGFEAIIWTCRSGEPLELAKKWLEQRGLDITYFNENSREQVAHWGTDPRKIAAELYIDDRIVGGFPGWQKVIKEVERLLSSGELEE